MTTGLSRTIADGDPTPHESTDDAASEAPMGLRERKKQQTRQLIANVALELFDQQGFAATTIPEIARLADVSPRTVSSYFPAKEELVFPDSQAGIDRLEARLAKREPGETTAEALRAWLASEAPEWEAAALRRTGELQRRVIAATPDLQHWMHRYRARGEDIVAHAVADDLGCDPGDLVARMASAATMAVFAVLEREDGDGKAATAEAVRNALSDLDQALLFVSAGIRAMQIARTEL